MPASRLILKAAVLGAGTMGSRIAAHLANAGIPVVLLDIASGGTVSNAQKALDILVRANPPAFYSPEAIRLITPGDFDHHLHLLSSCDWVIEAVTENLQVKRDLLSRVAPSLNERGILTTNTSGLPIRSIGEALPSELRRRWFGTHFFNPPRYMRLLEVVRTPETDPDAVGTIANFAGLRLGKTVVYAHDTPNFIANRIGVYVLMRAIHLMQEHGISVEEVDLLTGSALGWPRTGTFRLADMVGLDVLSDVVKNFPEISEHSFPIPAFLGQMLQRGWLGDKAGQGFYKTEKDSQGSAMRMAMDWRTLEYHPAKRPVFPTLEMAKNAETLAKRLLLLTGADAKKDKAAAFQWQLLTGLFQYAANCLPEIADEPASIDRAMRAGFNWELGPFEMWDALGVASTVERMRRERGMAEISPNVQKLLAAGHFSWYLENSASDGGKLVFDPVSSRYIAICEPAGQASMASFRKSRGVVSRNPGASLIDLGEGVGGIELHSQKDAIGDDIANLITRTLSPESSPVRDFEAFVISGDGINFSVGANLMQVLLYIQEEEWEELDLAVRAFQRMTWSIKFCPRPVVVAPYGMCLGGGAEIALHGTFRQPHAELYMGLVESGVGVLPAGGGTKEMALRAAENSQALTGSAVPGNSRSGISAAYLSALRRAFEVMAMAKVSTSAANAKALGYLSSCDRITSHRERVINDAKQAATTIAAAGYTAPMPLEISAGGEDAKATLTLGVHLMREAEYISDHDQNVALQIAHVLCGGSAPSGALITEQRLLDLEREAFLSLCGERKTQERIAYTLKTGKPLRN